METCRRPFESLIGFRTSYALSPRPVTSIPGMLSFYRSGINLKDLKALFQGSLTGSSCVIGGGRERPNASAVKDGWTSAKLLTETRKGVNLRRKTVQPGCTAGFSPMIMHELLQIDWLLQSFVRKINLTSRISGGSHQCE